MGYVIGIAAIIILGLIVTILILNKSKKKIAKEKDQAIKDATIAEKKLNTVKAEVDKVLDYNTEDKERKKVIDQHVKILKESKDTKGVVNEMENIRMDIYDILATL